MTTKKKVVGADVCPVRGCGSWVGGIDAAEMHEGSWHECKNRKHALVVAVKGGRAWLEPVRSKGGRLCRTEWRPKS